MIVAQRGFQASSRVITNGDEMLQEVVNLKRWYAAGFEWWWKAKARRASVGHFVAHSFTASLPPSRLSPVEVRRSGTLRPDAAASGLLRSNRSNQCGVRRRLWKSLGGERGGDRDVHGVMC